MTDAATPFDFRTFLQAVQSVVAQSTLLSAVQISEPKAPPENMTAAILLLNWPQVTTDLDGAIGRIEFLIRIYRNAMTEPTENMEWETGNAVLEMIGLFAGGFTLGGRIRAIDFAGEEGGRVDAKWGHLEMSGMIYRVVDITMSAIIDDVLVFTA